MLIEIGKPGPAPAQGQEAAFRPQQIASAITPKIQELIILPTERCNLRCTYCYEDFAIGKMKPSIQASVEQFIARRAPYIKQLRLNWFGGEPLLARDVVLRISKYAKELCESHGIDYQGGLTTNAYFLDRPLFEALLNNNQNFYQITLDGWRDVHDQVRKFADGRGSFDRIWSNLLNLKTVQQDFEVLLRIHVRRENIDSLSELLRNIAENFGNDGRFRLDFEHLRNLGGEGGTTVTRPLTLTELRQIEHGFRQEYQAFVAEYHATGQTAWASTHIVNDDVLISAKQAGESAGGQRAADLAAGGAYICYAAKANSLLVRANGRIGKCTVALNDSRNDIGHLNSDGSITIDNDKLRPWLRGLADLDEETLGCPLVTLPKF